MTRTIPFEDVAALVSDALDDFRATMPGDDLPPQLSLDTVLFGEDGVLDSLGIVNVVVLTERRVEDRFGVTVSLADEDALAIDDNPFRTVRSYVEFVRSLIESASLAGRATGSDG